MFQTRISHEVNVRHISDCVFGMTNVEYTPWPSHLCQTLAVFDGVYIIPLELFSIVDICTVEQVAVTKLTGLATPRRQYCRRRILPPSRLSSNLASNATTGESDMSTHEEVIYGILCGNICSRCSKVYIVSFGNR